MKVYPNPAVSNINIEILTQSFKATRYEVTNIEGQLTTSNSIKGSTIDVANLPAGCYFLTIYFSDGTIGKYKFLKEMK